MCCPTFSFRPNLQKADHQRAWAALQAVSVGQKSEFVVQAILRISETEQLRQIIREELAAVSVQKNDEKTADEQKCLPNGMLDFLDSL